jgi:hypothetical protein
MEAKEAVHIYILYVYSSAPFEQVTSVSLMFLFVIGLKYSSGSNIPYVIGSDKDARDLFTVPCESIAAWSSGGDQHYATCRGSRAVIRQYRPTISRLWLIYLSPFQGKSNCG